MEGSKQEENRKDVQTQHATHDTAQVSWRRGNETNETNETIITIGHRSSVIASIIDHRLQFQGWSALARQIFVVHLENGVLSVEFSGSENTIDGIANYLLTQCSILGDAVSDEFL